MRKLLSLSTVVITVIFSPLSARAELSRICTREPGTTVTLRKAPGSNYSKGLVQVGSGGNYVNNYFKQRNYTLPDREEVSSFRSRLGRDGYSWSLVGTNQWQGWVRSDFVCRRS